MDKAPLLWALDISKSRTGIAIGRAGETPRSYSLVGEKIDIVEVMGRLFTWLLDRSKLDKPDWLFYEAPLSGGAFVPDIDWEAREWHSRQSPHTTFALAKMTGTVELFAHMKSIAMRAVNVKTARVEFIGAGNLKGSEAKKRARAMCELLKWPAANADEADALCVWHYGTIIAAKRLAYPIIPSMHAKVATTIGGVDIGDVDALFPKSKPVQNRSYWAARRARK